MKESLELGAISFTIKAISEMLNEASKIMRRSSRRTVVNPYLIIPTWENKDRGPFL
ncbi:hypothetical protein [Thermosphaera sp.]